MVMKAPAFTLIAATALLGCAESGDRDNQAQAANDAAFANAVETASPETALPPAGANQSRPAAPDNGVGGPEVKDEPISGGGSRPAGPPPADEANACGASRYQHLVGRPRSAIPPKPAGATWRITCTGCPITMDHSPQRLNIFYDAETERIDEVRCG